MRDGHTLSQHAYDSPPFGATTLTKAGVIESDIFIVKYDSLGNVIWAKSAGGSSGDYASGITSDTKGNVYITGYFYSPILTIGNAMLINSGDVDIFVAKYDSSANFIWAKNAGGTNFSESNGINIDSSGNVYVTGWFGSSIINFGTDTLIDTGALPVVFIAKPGNTITGINTDPALSNSITSYPSPTTGTIFLKGIEPGNKLEVYNVLGETVYSSIATGDNYSINLALKAKGIYFYRVTDNSVAVQQGKIILE